MLKFAKSLLFRGIQIFSYFMIPAWCTYWLKLIILRAGQIVSGPLVYYDKAGYLGYVIMVLVISHSFIKLMLEIADKFANKANELNSTRDLRSLL